MVPKAAAWFSIFSPSLAWHGCSVCGQSVGPFVSTFNVIYSLATSPSESCFSGQRFDISDLSK